MTVSRRFSLYFSTSLVQGAAGLVSLLVVIPSLTIREVGYVAALETVTYLFMAVAGLSLDRAMARLYYDRPTDAERAQLAHTLQVATILSVIVFLAITIALADVIKLVVPEISFWPYVFLALSRAAFELLTRVLHSFFVASGDAGNLALITWLGAPIGLAASVFLVLVLKMGLLGYLGGQCIGAASTYVLTRWRTRNLRSTFNKADLEESLHYSWPFIPALIIAWILSYTDRVFIARFMTIDDLGIYGLAIRFASVFLLVTVALQKSVYPTYYAVAAGPPKGLAEFSRAYISLLTAVAVIFMFAFAWFIEVVFHDRYRVPTALLGFIVVNHWLSLVAFLSAEAIVRAKKTSWSMVIGIFLATVSLSLNLLLVPVLGLYGSIIAGFASALFTFGIQVLVARRFVAVPVPWGFFAASTAILVLGGYLLSTAPLLYQVVYLALALGLLAKSLVRSTRFFSTH